uniref:Uncharacterized protein n=1 Tax=Falco tinnunculus TaxID=100819 RepID=A0A8C4VBY9_FALTI
MWGTLVHGPQGCRPHSAPHPPHPPQAWWVLPDEETVNLWYDCVLQNSTHSWVCASVADSRE